MKCHEVASARPVLYTALALLQELPKTQPTLQIRYGGQRCVD